MHRKYLDAIRWRATFQELGATNHGRTITVRQDVACHQFDTHHGLP